MSDNKLARMANDIASFFQSYPHEQAVAGIHDHIKAFWTPKMRTTLGNAVAAGATGLNPLVVEAMTRAPQARNPAEKEAAGPAVVGEIGASDAG
jgi:formate dehydrogenase subunit delta